MQDKWILEPGSGEVLHLNPKTGEYEKKAPGPVPKPSLPSSSTAGHSKKNVPPPGGDYWKFDAETQEVLHWNGVTGEYVKVEAPAASVAVVESDEAEPTEPTEPEEPEVDPALGGEVEEEPVG